MTKAKIGIVSLGCDKNTVDSEKMLHRISAGGHEIVTDPTLADVIIINTCAFIEAARKEAVDTILEYATLGKKLIITGCFSEKYIDEIFDELIEVHGFLGVNDYAKIIQAIEDVLDGKRVNFVKSEDSSHDKNAEDVSYDTERVQSTPRHYAYLKIADGCQNRCTFCTIPSIRGDYRSFPLEKLVAEATTLAQSGVKELILVAQDTTAYGIDLYGKYNLVELLQRLTAIEGIVWVRLLYCYPEKISDELVDEIAKNPKICKYLDIPLQHISDGILQKMGRKYDKAYVLSLLKKLFARMPDISIRSTFMVGFPTETEEQFEELCNFLEQHKIENAGFFAYSCEDGTAAANLPQLDHEVKSQRLEKIQNFYQNICLERQAKKQDKMVTCMVEYYDKDACFYVCRSEGNAPLIDTSIFVDTTDFVDLHIGQIIDVLITGTDGYDLLALYTA